MKDCNPDIEELAEAYCLEKLCPQRKQEFERHCACCTDCAARLDRVRQFLAMLRSAARNLSLSGPNPEDTAMDLLGLLYSVARNNS